MFCLMRKSYHLSRQKYLQVYNTEQLDYTHTGQELLAKKCKVYLPTDNETLFVKTILHFLNADFTCIHNKSEISSYPAKQGTTKN